MKSNKEYIENILNKVDDYKLRQKRRNRVILSSLCGLFLVVGIGIMGLKNNIVNNIVFHDNLPRFESEEETSKEGFVTSLLVLFNYQRYGTTILFFPFFIASRQVPLINLGGR